MAFRVLDIVTFSAFTLYTLARFLLDHRRAIFWRRYGCICETRRGTGSTEKRKYARFKFYAFRWKLILREVRIEKMDAIIAQVHSGAVLNGR